MNTCRWTERVEAYFDHESTLSFGVEAHLADCRTCARHLASLAAMRSAVGDLHTPVIADAQFSAFMNGIRDGIEAPRQRYRSVWAMFSLVTAALVVALTTFALFTGPEAVRADNPIQIETIRTDIKGATVNWSEDDETLWIHEDDIQ